MQADKKPSRWALVGAQILAYGLTLIVTLILFFFLSIILPTRQMSSSWLLLAVVILVPGGLLAALQRGALRKWSISRAPWLIAGAVAVPVLLLVEYALCTRYLLPAHLPPNWLAGDFTHLYAVQAVVNPWSLIAGLMVGLPAGLIFGLVQGYFLPWYRRMWWLLSALAWGVITALALYLVNSLTLVVNSL